MLVIPEGEVIETTKPGAPGIPVHIKQELESMRPRVFLRWNNAYKKTGAMASNGAPIYEGRWEIWCEVEETNHPDASNERARTDIWNDEARCWMRKLQTYNDADGEFAPADWGLILGLRAAERAFTDRHFYDEMILEPDEEARQAPVERAKEALRGGREYYQDFDRTLVGPHVSGDWRWRTR